MELLSLVCLISLFSSSLWILEYDSIFQLLQSKLCSFPRGRINVRIPSRVHLIKQWFNSSFLEASWNSITPPKWLWSVMAIAFIPNSLLFRCFVWIVKSIQKLYNIASEDGQSFHLSLLLQAQFVNGLSFAYLLAINIVCGTSLRQGLLVLTFFLMHCD